MDEKLEERVRAEMEVEDKENTTNNPGLIQATHQKSKMYNYIHVHYCAGSKTTKAKKRARTVQKPDTCTYNYVHITQAQ